MPQGLIDEAFERIDREKVISALTENIEQRIANKIADTMQTELANDVKSIMSNKVLRGQIRDSLAVAMRKIIEGLMEQK